MKTNAEKLLEAARLVREVVVELDKTMKTICSCGKQEANNLAERAQFYLLKDVPHRLRVAAKEINRDPDAPRSQPVRAKEIDREAVWLKANPDEITHMEGPYAKYVFEEPVVILVSGFYEIVAMETGKCRLVLLEERAEPPEGYPT